MSKKYYVARNVHGNEYSCGFANTWYVLAFGDRKSRDNYVEVTSARDISVRAITKREITSYIVEAPRKFSNDHYCIDPLCYATEFVAGCLGVVTTYYHSSGRGTIRLFEGGAK